MSPTPSTDSDGSASSLSTNDVRVWVLTSEGVLAHLGVDEANALLRPRGGGVDTRGDAFFRPAANAAPGADESAVDDADADAAAAATAAATAVATASPTVACASSETSAAGRGRGAAGTADGAPARASAPRKHQLTAARATAYADALRALPRDAWQALHGAWLSTYAVPPRGVFPAMHMPEAGARELLGARNAAALLYDAAVRAGVRPAGIVAHHRGPQRRPRGASAQAGIHDAPASAAEPLSFAVPTPPGVARVYVDGKKAGGEASAWAPPPAG